MKRAIRETADGSHTLYVEELDETYHSSHGAVQEALHVFIRHGLEFVQDSGKEDIRILEMGFGTGLNAWLSAVYARIPVHYAGIEAFPVESAVLNQLNYTRNAASAEKELFKQIVGASWSETVEIRPDFTLRKWHTGLMEAELTAESYDLVYYDAFGPRAQSELWELEPLGKIVDSLKTGGVCVTYCAQGQFRRNLKALGMRVESLPGPPGKREMTRAIKA